MSVMTTDDILNHMHQNTSDYPFDYLTPFDYSTWQLGESLGFEKHPQDLHRSANVSSWGMDM